MNVLIIAPLPPPMSGNALPAKVLFDELKVNHNVETINLNKNSHSSGIDSFERVIQVLKILFRVWKMKNEKDIIYLTVAESFAGNLRDIFIYLICYRQLSRIVIHMFGGAVFINKQNKVQHAINKFFVSKLGGILVEGQTQRDIFSQLAPIEKIQVVHNFAEDFLFTSEVEIKEKFAKTEPLKILFLSNLIYGKGYDELANAYRGLKDDIKNKIVLDFAGAVDTDAHKEDFLAKIAGLEGVKYHGSVAGIVKKDLYSSAHIFCLPTYYPYEGQPFCILEAYSTGCVVVTTNHSGIRNVFQAGVNGFEVEKRSVDSLKAMLETLVETKESLSLIALANLATARKKHTKIKYISTVLGVFDKVIEKNSMTNKQLEFKK